MYDASSSSCASEDWPMLYLGTVAVLAGFGLLINLIALWVCVNVDQPPRAWALPMLLLPWMGLIVALAASVGLGLEAANQGESPWPFLLAGAGAHLGALAAVVTLIRSVARRAGRDDTSVRGAAKPCARAGDARGSGAKSVRVDAVGITADDTPEHGGSRRAGTSEEHDGPSTPPDPRPSATGGAARTRSPGSHEDWQARVIRRPDDVGCGIVLQQKAEKYFEHHHRLMDWHVPAGCHTGEAAAAGDALAVLALGETIHRTVLSDRPWSVHDALKLGATWTEVAAALDGTTAEARAILRTYAEVQRQQYEETAMSGYRPSGYSPEEHRSALALIRLADDDRSSRQ
ncbi:PLD nuclease N-terminal domain-containing protein [Streptomyces sp. NBC_00233]|uniref:PLD nuclease N-terminal domain-containing protein n=1 Tax=Streptomyces sp. NBC_00233 TaxID=2975686 RepID=UPI002251D5F5|nr:PLD nuclease N-terminal domain-containing protein [Streptomyces sp. NBC_00233]MCX5232621.1 PLD nuclease N-terminal domain-containing protein [Streptomyces sp. NBC_00233]